MQEVLQIPFRDKIINLYFEEIDENIDIDELTVIDYNNLFAEIITIPALMNRVGLWKAESEAAYAECKLDINIYEAQTAEYFRRKLVTLETDTKGKSKKKYPTKDEVDNSVMLDEQVQLRKKKLIRLQKEVAMMDSLYWAVKSKEMKLNKLIESANIVPEDFVGELVTKKWNGVLIKVKERLK